MTIEVIAESAEIRCQNVGRHVWVAGNAETCRRCGISWNAAHNLPTVTRESWIAREGEAY